MCALRLFFRRPLAAVVVTAMLWLSSTTTTAAAFSTVRVPRINSAHLRPQHRQSAAMLLSSSSSSVNNNSNKSNNNTPQTTTTTTKIKRKKKKKIKAADTRAQGRKRLAAGMAFVVGWADICLFTSPQLKTFATMMTGNALWMVLALAEQRFRDVAYYASVIAAYLSGLALFRRIDLSLRKQTLPLSALLVAALLVGGDAWHYLVQGAAVATRPWIPITMFATAFGMANSVGSEVCGTLTFVVTGHMTRLANAVVDRISKTAGHQPLDKAIVLQNGSVLLGFVAGALWAGWLKRRNWLHQFGNFAVMGVLYAAMWLWHDIESLGGAWWLRKDGAMCEVEDDGVLCEEDENDNDNSGDDAKK